MLYDQPYDPAPAIATRIAGRSPGSAVKYMEEFLTDRLRLRRPTAEDAAFFVRLMNDADWLRYIGDRGVRSEQDAVGYIENRLLDSFRRFGFGLWVVET